jgi:hypothetical protein
MPPQQPLGLGLPQGPHLDQVPLSIIMTRGDRRPDPVAVRGLVEHGALPKGSKHKAVAVLAQAENRAAA